MKARKILGFGALFGASFAATFVFQKSANSPQILLSNATAAPLETDPNQLAVFVKIENSGQPDTLLSASSPEAETSTLSERHGPLAVPAGGTASLAADGVFLQLNNLSGPLDDGRTLPISLTFTHAGTLTTRARIISLQTKGNAANYGLFGISDVCQVGEGEPAPNISLEATKTEAGWSVSITSEDFEFTPTLVDGPHVPGTGHGHIYLNGLKLGRLYSAETTIGNLPFGQHEVRVTLSTNDHRAYVVDDAPVTASIRIHSD